MVELKRSRPRRAITQRGRIACLGDQVHESDRRAVRIVPKFGWVARSRLLL